MPDVDRILRGHSIQIRDGRAVILDHMGAVWHHCGPDFSADAASEIVQAYKSGHAAGVRAGRIAKASEIAAALAEGS